MTKSNSILNGDDRQVKKLVYVLLFFTILLQPFLSLAAIITSTTSGGNWNIGSTWVGGSVPAVGDLVVIATTSGNSVTLTGVQTCAGLTINSGAVLNLSSFTLTVNGPWLNNGTFNDDTGTVTFGTALAAINAGTGSANFENIIIASGATMNINTDVTVNGNFDFVLPAANNIVNINSTNTLDIAGNVTMNLPTATRNSTMAVGSGTLTVSGLFNMQSQATSGRANIITISTGIANLNGGYSTGTTAPTISTGSKITFTDSGILNLSGTISGGAPAMVQSTGTINFKGATAQDIWLETYYNLGVFDGTKSLLGNITVQNQLNLASGTFQVGSFNVVISGSGDAFIATGTFDPGTALVTMSGAAATNIPSTTFNNLTVSGGTKTLPAGSNLTVNGNWAQNTAVVLDGDANATVIGRLNGYGTLTIGSGTLTLDSTYASSGVLTPGTGTIKYVGGGTIKGNITYYNLEIDGDRSLAASATVSNILTVNSGRTLSMLTRNLTLNGGGNPIVNNGTITSTSGALTFAGTDPQVIASGTYPKTTLTNGTKTISNGNIVNITGAFLVNAPLNMEGDGSAIITGATTGTGAITMDSGTLTFVATFAGGTFTAGTGKVVYAGIAAQAVRVGIGYYDLELASSVSNSIASTTMAIGNNLIVESTTTMATSTTLNIVNDVLGTGAITATGFVNLGGDWLHTGTFTPGTGTIHYNGTDQLVKSLSYYKLSMTGGTKSLEGNTTATHLVSINPATILNLNAFTLDLQGPTVNALLNSGTLSGNGKVRYSAAGAQTVNSSTFYDLEFTGGAKTIATGNNIEVTNDWTVSANTLMTSAQNATVGRDLIHNTGALIDQGSGTIRIGRNWTANGGTFDRGTGTVIYEGANQTIAPFTYATLTCSGTGTKTITGDVDISGVLTINSGVTFDRSTYTVTLSFTRYPTSDRWNTDR
jgi:fibronectin-binding autotransporter adhesin